MDFHTCKSCRTDQRVAAHQITQIDEGSLGTITWWRCGRCDQLSPTTKTIVREYALSA